MTINEHTNIEGKFVNTHIVMMAISFLIPLAGIFALIKLYKERKKYKNSLDHKYMFNITIVRISYLLTFIIGLGQIGLIIAILLPNIMRFIVK